MIQSIKPIQNLLTRLRRTRGAAMLRAAAGRAVETGPRRGTVLVLVIGALALISVITLVYATIGQGDRRLSASTIQQSNIRVTGEAVGEYIALKIGDGSFSLMVDGEYMTQAVRSNPLLVRPAADYPWTDPYRRSCRPPNLPAGSPLADRRFDPTGSYDTLWTAANVDPRQPSTPFLATTQPVQLNPTPTTGSPPDVLAMHDWMHLTNLAPDGRFVNLWNLAPVIGGQRVGNFRATSAITVQASGRGVPAQPSFGAGSLVISEMSFGLSLFDASGNPTTTLDFTGGGPADPNIPAHWSDRQQWMYRPAAGPMYFPPTAPVDPTTGLSPNKPGSLYYPPYQYCDTDGDGLFDARWFELVDATDPNNPISFLPKDDRYRWFAAARVVDLSSMVNVNTATEFRSPASAPTQTPITLFGATPADVDLRRLLTMDDTYRLYTGLPGLPGYAGLEQPATPGPDDYSSYIQLTARNVGDRGYRALRLALASASESVVPPNQSLGNAAALWRDERYTYYTSFGGQAESSYRLSNATPLFSGSARYTAADLKELLTYWATNNAASTSRLEQTVDGRFDAANGGSIANASFGPLRSNRGDLLERGGIDNAENAGQGDGKADPDAMLRSVFDVRHSITPLSWSRPLRSSVIPPPSTQTGRSFKSQLDSSVDLKVDVARGLAAATATTYANQDPSAIFKGYTSALMPYSWVRSSNPSASVWDKSSPLATLNFARNAELTLRIAANMTANLIDSYDKNALAGSGAGAEDNNPHAFTLLISEDKRNSLQGDDRFTWWNQTGNTSVNTFPGRLDLGPTNLAKPQTGTPTDPATEASLGAVNIYGIEAQPFVTHVESFFIYTDSPASAGGDEEVTGEGIPPIPSEITINGAITSSDNLGQVIAFQLTNPFDVDINLTQSGNSDTENPIADNEFSEYYIQFGGDMNAGGNVYKLAWYREGSNELMPVVLHKGETRTFYCLNDSVANLESKWHRSEGALSQGTVQKFLDTQLATAPAAGVTYSSLTERTADQRIKPIQIRQMAASGATQPTASNNLFNGSSTSNKHILLWRTLHSSMDPAGAGNLNKRGNDQLVDHLRDPGLSSDPTKPTLDRRLPSQNRTVAGTTVPEDDTGFSLVLWGSIKRRNDPGLPGGSPPLGAIPAYCVEAKWGTGTTLSNVSDAPTIDPDHLTRSDFTNPAIFYAQQTLKSLSLKVAIDTDPPGPPFALTGVIKKTMTQMPKDWVSAPGNAMPTNQDTPPRKYEDLYPQIYLNNNKFEGQINPAANSPKLSTLRLADLLLPLGVGPICDPGIGNGTQDPDAWMTLSEALALALNYSNPGATTPGWGIYDKVGDSQNGVLDRGNLALDRGVPYQRFSAVGAPFDPAVDRPRWPRIPLSLNILNTFTVTDAQYGDLTHAQPGVININTAPLPVLMTIPLLAPTTEPGVWTAWKNIVGVSGTSSVPEAPTAPFANDGTDLASGILAYREKLRIGDRDSQIINFADGTGNPFSATGRDGRNLTNKIPGLRESNGFATPGEILTLVDRTGPSNTPGTSRITVRGDQIDGLSHDNLPSGAVGLSTTVYKDSAGVQRADAIPDDYSEKLLIAQSALGSMTVRSDLFAVWFVIQGYQKSDTDGLSLNDPLKPSVSKRYLMVVDRSNVTRKGEKPRIVFMTEVPM